jgi:pilus assembly protein Flp/PilA
LELILFVNQFGYCSFCFGGLSAFLGYRPEEAVVFIRSASTVVPPGGNIRTRDIAIGCGHNSGNMKMMKILNNLKKSKSGASAAEYALIVAVLGGFVVGGASLFGQSLTDTMEQTGDALEAESTDDFGTGAAATT